MHSLTPANKSWYIFYKNSKELRLSLHSYKTRITPLSNKDKKTTKSLRGTTVALIKQAFLEVSTTICKKLNLVGVGYKVFPVETELGNLIHLKLGYSHSLYFKIPETVNIKCYKADKLFISGHDLSLVAQTAALIRSCKVPEPYKGKGIVYSTEIIKLKEGKKV